MTLAKVFVHALFLIFLTGSDMVAAQGISNLLSRLFNSAVQSNRPLVLIIDKNDLREEQKPPLKPSHLVLETSSEGEEEIQPAVYLIQSQMTPSPPSPPSPPPPPPQKRLPPARGLAALGGLGLGGLGSIGGLGSLGGLGNLAGVYEVPVYRPRGHYHPKVHRGHLKVVGRPTPSPLVKLLRQSECDATEACIDKCKTQFSAKKRKVCKAKCEITYECVPVADQDEDYDDPCEDDEMECGNRNPSTRGIMLVTPEKPPCTRC